MSENKTSPVKKSFSLDWLMRGVLTRLGDTFDRLTGRGWKPSSSLATSELIERLKKLLDSEAKNSGGKNVFVPHHIQLKMQWDKFSVDSENSEKALKKLENELLVAAVDHINDRRYHTYAPLELEIKPDYFTEGVKLHAGFDKFAEEEREAELNVTVPDLKNISIVPPENVKVEPEKETFVAEFMIKDKPRRVELTFSDGQRKSVGRTKENDLCIDDESVSKIHAALVLNSEKQLMVADTGSTNGTFVNGQRISYGKAFAINNGDKLKFGSVDVALEHLAKQVEEEIFDEEFSDDEATLVKKNNSSAKENIPIAIAGNSADGNLATAEERFSTNENEGVKKDFAESSSFVKIEPETASEFGEKK